MIEVRPATPQCWDDVVSVFGRRAADPSWCWCRRFLTAATAATSRGAADNRSALKSEIAGALVAPGLLAYADGRPAGWSRVGPRSQFPAVGSNRALARILDDDPDAWWVACFAIDPRQRRSGVGTALLEAAVGFAREHGARTLEGQPVDVKALAAGRAGASALFTGTAAMFARVGFAEVGRTAPARPVMRLAL